MKRVKKSAGWRFVCLTMLAVVFGSAPIMAANGLVGRYCNNDIDAVGNDFELLNFDDVQVIRRDAKVDFGWGGSPAPGVNKDYFTVQWTGRIVPRYSEEYTFSTRADDGVRLFVNGELVVNDWNSHGPQTHSGAIALEAGVAYDITLEFFDHFSGCCVKLMWESESQAQEVVPSECLFIPEDAAAPVMPSNLQTDAVGDRAVVLSWDASADDVATSYYNIYRDGVLIGTTYKPAYRDATLTPDTSYLYSVKAVDVADKTSPMSESLSVTTLSPIALGTGTGLLARYYNNKDLTDRVLVRVDQTVDFAWEKGSPNASIGKDTFSTSWRGAVQPLYDGEYTFTLRSDDGMRLWIGGQVVVNDWSNHGPRNRSGSVTLKAGGMYEIRVDHYENTGSAVAKLYWESALQPKEIIPATQLYPEEYLAGTEVKLMTPLTSITSPAWVEGKVGDDAVNVAVSVNGEAAFDAVRENANMWYASNAPEGAAPGIVLDPAAAVNIDVTATDADGTTGTESYVLDWTPTVLNDLTFSQDSVTIRQGDSLLFYVEPQKADLRPIRGRGWGRYIQMLRKYIGIDADGDGRYDFFAKADTPLAFLYNEPGTYVVDCRRVLGRKIGTLTVNVVGVDTDGPVACEVGFKREKGVEISPLEFAEDVRWVSRDVTELGVSLKEYTDYGARLYLTALKRGTPTFQARLGSAYGPLLVEQEVDEFVVVHSSLNHIVVNSDENRGMATFEIHPYIPDLNIILEMFAHSSTFEGGFSKLVMNTNDLSREKGQNGIMAGKNWTGE